jgi:TATA-box binding protein (TBP) (component of TFIID and TFIIIB)
MTNKRDSILLDAELTTHIETLNSKFETFKKTPFYIVTITLLYKTSFCVKDLSLLTDRTFASAASQCNAYITNFKQFKNSIILKFQNNKMSIKIFVNGSIHVTGVKTFETAHDTVNLVCTILKLVFSYDKDIKIISHTIQMLNVCCKSKYSFNMNKLFKLFLELEDVIVTYDQEQHAAIKIKKEIKGPSIMIFKSGSIIICGCKTSEQMLASGTLLIKIFDDVDYQTAVLKDF